MNSSSGINNLNLLIIDDDKKLCRLVSEYLSPMGYQVDMAHNGTDGLKKALYGDFQVIILDVMLPEMDGFEVLQNLRKESDIPVLMLTARGDETDRIVGLEMGADDYLPKTFSTRELLARLRAVTRRFQASSTVSEKKRHEDSLIFDELTINISSHTVSMDAEKIELTPLEFDLLLNLARAAGRVLSRDQLLDSVAGRNYEVFDRSIDVHISSLRRKIKDNPKVPRFIRTVRSLGYMFIDGEI